MVGFTFSFSCYFELTKIKDEGGLSAIISKFMGY